MISFPSIWTWNFLDICHKLDVQIKTTYLIDVCVPKNITLLSSKTNYSFS
jgi:hypothetical protein